MATSGNTATLRDDSLYDADDELCDMEVGFFMGNQTREDVCICQKYRNPFSTKPCPVCSLDHVVHLRQKPRWAGREVNRTFSDHDRSLCMSSSPAMGRQGHGNKQARHHYAASSKEFSVGTLMKKKRRPRVIPAAEYFDRHYLPLTMTNGEFVPRPQASFIEANRPLDGDVGDLSSANKSQDNQNVRSGENLASELSRIYI